VLALLLAGVSNTLVKMMMRSLVSGSVTAIYPCDEIPRQSRALQIWSGTMPLSPPSKQRRTLHPMTYRGASMCSGGQLTAC